MDANAACSEIPSEYSVFMCKAETLHYLHVCLLHAAAVFQALKCAFLPRDGRYFTFLESVTSDRLLSDRGPISFFFLYRFIEINLGKTNGLLRCRGVCG